jgi:hypothetical protein
MSTICPAIVRYVVLADADEVQINPAASDTMPPATTNFVPAWTASPVPRTEVMPTIVATGSNRTPVSSGP